MHRIEPLESRIAPAAVFSFTDVDGDVVKITASKGTNADLASAAHISLGQLQSLDLSAATFGAEFSHANVTITATPGMSGGDGQVNVGFINATGSDLGKVTIAGDLGRLSAGDAVAATPALGSLHVTSIGALGLTTQAAGGTLTSTLAGSVGQVKVLGDIVGATYFCTGKTSAISIGGSVVDGTLLVSGGSDRIHIGGDLLGNGPVTGKITSGAGSIGSIVIGGNIRGSASDSGNITSSGAIGLLEIRGSLIGGAGADSGEIDAKSVGILKIGGDVMGAAGLRSGYVAAGGNGTLLSIGGSLIGGSGSESGRLNATSYTELKIGGNIVGGGGNASGYAGVSNVSTAFVGGSIYGGADGTLSAGDLAISQGKTITIQGSVIGGAGQSSGLVISNTIGTINIAGSVVGGNSTVVGGTLSDSGAIGVNTVGHLNIGGSLVAGTSAPGCKSVNCGALFAVAAFGDVKIGGSIVGNASNAASIEVGFAPKAPGATVLKSLTVGGAVDQAEILAGYNESKVAMHGDVKVGAINVGSWSASNLVVGVDAGADQSFGTIDDVRHVGGDPAIHSSIASIVIRGRAIGSAAAGDHFGIVAEQIGSVKIGGYQVPLSAAKTDVFRLGSTGGAVGDFFVREDV